MSRVPDKGNATQMCVAFKHLGRLLGRLLGKPIESQTQRKCVSRFLIKRYLGRLLGRPLGIPNATQMCVAFFYQSKAVG